MMTPLCTVVDWSQRQFFLEAQEISSLWIQDDGHFKNGRQF